LPISLNGHHNNGIVHDLQRFAQNKRVHQRTIAGMFDCPPQARKIRRRSKRSFQAVAQPNTLARRLENSALKSRIRFDQGLSRKENTEKQQWRVRPLIPIRKVRTGDCYHRKKTSRGPSLSALGLWRDPHVRRDEVNLENRQMREAKLPGGREAGDYPKKDAS